MLRYLPLFLALLCWAWPPVITRWIGLDGMDVFSQNMFRVAVSAAVFIPLGFLVRGRGMRRALENWRRFVLPAFLLAAAQACWLYGLVFVGATFSALLGRIDILLTVLVGVMFFEDERKVVRQRGFIPALLVTLAGVVGVVLFRRGAGGDVKTEGGLFALGVGLTLLSSLFWVGYVYAVKLVVGPVGAIVTLVSVNAFSAVFTGLICVIMTFVGLAEPSSLLHAPPSRLWALAASGLVGMGGGVLYIRSIDTVGVTVSQTGILALPVVVGIVSFFWLGEYLSIGQWLSGAVLLCGLGMVIWLEYRSRRRERLEVPCPQAYRC